MPDSGESIKSISALKQDPKNARKRTAQSKHLIQESLNRYGAARSIVIDETDRILAGNGTIEGAKAAGISKVRIIETDGDEIIAVRRVGLTEHEKVGLALADNRTSDLSEWDAEMLHNLSQEQDIAPWFSEDDIAELLGKKDDFDPDDPTTDQSNKITDVFQIIVNCTSEQQQTDLLNRLLDENFECRALNS
jgi:ParB-like chromosome segregation protein Spo0J